MDLAPFIKSVVIIIPEENIVKKISHAVEPGNHFALSSTSVPDAPDSAGILPRPKQQSPGHLPNDKRPPTRLMACRRPFMDSPPS